VVLVKARKVVLERTISGIMAIASPSLVVNEVLRKYAEVQEESDKRASQPAEVDEHVLAVDVACLARLAGGLLAVRLVCKDRQYICNVPQARKEEEQHAEAICRFASPVQYELRQARGNVGDGAEPAKDLPEHVELQCATIIVRMVAMFHFVSRLLAQEPTQDTSSDHHKHRDRIPNDGLQSRSRRGQRCVWDMRHRRGQARPV
jgi:hypothetical protein